MERINHKCACQLVHASVSKIPTAEISQVKVMGKFHLKTFTVFCRLESCTKIQRGLAISLLPPNNLLNAPHTPPPIS